MGHYYFAIVLICTGLLVSYVQSFERPLHFILYRGRGPLESQRYEEPVESSMTTEAADTATTALTESDGMSIDSHLTWPSTSVDSHSSRTDLIDLRNDVMDWTPQVLESSTPATPSNSVDLGGLNPEILDVLWAEWPNGQILEEDMNQDEWMDFLNDRDIQGDQVSRMFFYTSPTEPHDIQVLPNCLKRYGLSRYFSDMVNAFAPTLSYRSGFLAWPEFAQDYEWTPVAPYYFNFQIPLYSMPGISLMKDWAFADVEEREYKDDDSFEFAQTSRLGHCKVAWYPDFIAPEYAIAVCDQNNVDGISTAIENWHARVFTFDEKHELSRDQYLHGQYSSPRVNGQQKPVFPSKYFTKCNIATIILPRKGVAFVNDQTGVLAFYQVETQSFEMVEPKTSSEPFGHHQSNFIVVDDLLYWITVESDPAARVIYILDTPTTAESSYRWREIQDHPFTTNMEYVPIMELPAHLIDPTVATEIQSFIEFQQQQEQVKLNLRISGKKKTQRKKKCGHAGCKKKSVGMTECVKCHGTFCPLHATTHRCGQKNQKQVKQVPIIPMKIDHV